MHIHDRRNKCSIGLNETVKKMIALCAQRRAHSFFDLNKVISGLQQHLIGSINRRVEIDALEIILESISIYPSTLQRVQ